MTKEIMVVKREYLFSGDSNSGGEFQGFVSVQERDYIPLILSKHEYALRDEGLENNPSLKQVIPYVVIVNPKTRGVFGYKRFKKMPGMHESRLHGKFSIGVGGHVDREETKVDVLTDATMRELKEEVRMDQYSLPKIVGFVNDELDSVGQVHFGIVAIAETDGKVSKMENEEVTEEKFYSVSEVDDLINSGAEMDGWTKISWPFVKDYLFKL